MATIQSLLAPTRCLFASLRPVSKSTINHAQPVSRLPMTAQFSTSPPLYARNKRGPKKDQRISASEITVHATTLETLKA